MKVENRGSIGGRIKARARRRPKVDIDFTTAELEASRESDHFGRASPVGQPKKKWFAANAGKFKAAVGDHVDSSVAVGDGRVITLGAVKIGCILFGDSKGYK